MPHAVQPAKLLRILAVLTGSVCMAAPLFAQEPQAKNASAPQAAVVGETLEKTEKPIKTGVAGSFLSGRFATENQDMKQAAKYINQSLANDPNNQRLKEEALRLNLLAGNMDIATGLAKKLSSEGENDPLIASLMMLDYVKAGDYASAKTVINAAPSVGLFGLIRPVILQWIAIGAAETKGPVDLQAAIDKSGFFAPFLTYHAALMNDVLGKNAEAEASYLKATSDTKAAPYRVIQALANYYMRQGKWAEAQAVYANYVKSNPNSTLILDKIAPGEPPAPIIGNAREGLAEVFFTTASLLFSDDSAQDTFLYLRIALELRPNLAPGQLMLANLYEQVHDYPQAIKTYDLIGENTPFYRRAQVRKALNYEAVGEKMKAIDLLDSISKRYPDDATPLITKGDLLRDNEEYSAAASAYSAAIKRSEPLKNSDWPLLYARGISYERMGEWDKAEADLTRALVLEPNQPDVLNYLGYSWLTMNKNLVKAREYLDVAAASRPDDGNIADSVGWAHFLAGDFQYAANQFERAQQLLPGNATVGEHLGDAYWRLGRETEARYQWTQALAFKPEKDVEKSLRTKIENGLPAYVAPTAVNDAAAPVKETKDARTPAKTQVQ